MAQKASEELLGELHKKLAEAFLEKLKDPENFTASDANAIRQFLKDNDITVDAAASPELGELMKSLNDIKVDVDYFEGTA